MFFFQAEDGIRDYKVTGVQTCALPISAKASQVNRKMNHRKIVVTQPVHEEVLRKLQAEGEVIMNPGPDPWSPSQLREYLVDADAMMAFMTDKIGRASCRERV